MSKMEQKQIQRPSGGTLEKKYQVFELNGMKLDYFDIELALMGLSTLILEYQDSVRKNPECKRPRYDGMLHTAEKSFKESWKKWKGLQKMRLDLQKVFSNILEFHLNMFLFPPLCGHIMSVIQRI